MRNCKLDAGTSRHFVAMSDDSGNVGFTVDVEGGWLLGGWSTMDSHTTNPFISDFEWLDWFDDHSIWLGRSLSDRRRSLRLASF